MVTWWLCGILMLCFFAIHILLLSFLWNFILSRDAGVQLYIYIAKQEISPEMLLTQNYVKLFDCDNIYTKFRNLDGWHKFFDMNLNLLKNNFPYCWNRFKNSIYISHDLIMTFQNPYMVPTHSKKKLFIFVVLFVLWSWIDFLNLLLLCFQVC